MPGPGPGPHTFRLSSPRVLRPAERTDGVGKTASPRSPRKGGAGEPSRRTSCALAPPSPPAPSVSERTLRQTEPRDLFDGPTSTSERQAHEYALGTWQGSAFKSDYSKSRSHTVKETALTLKHRQVHRLTQEAARPIRPFEHELTTTKLIVKFSSSGAPAAVRGQQPPEARPWDRTAPVRSTSLKAQRPVGRARPAGSSSDPCVPGRRFPSPVSHGPAAPASPQQLSLKPEKSPGTWMTTPTCRV